MNGTPLNLAGNIQNLRLDLGSTVTLNGTQTLVNKSIDASSNTIVVDSTNINELIDQDVRTTASPTFVAIRSGATYTDTVANSTDDGELTIITETNNANINLSPNGTGKVIIKEGTTLNVDSIAPNGAEIGLGSGAAMDQYGNISTGTLKVDFLDSYNETQIHSNKIINSGIISNILVLPALLEDNTTTKILGAGDTGGVSYHSDIVDLATGQTLTNKIIDSAANTVKINGTDVNNLVDQDVRSSASPTFVAIRADATFTDTIANSADDGDLTIITETNNANINLSPNGTGSVKMTQNGKDLMTLGLESGLNSLRLGGNSLVPHVSLGDSAGTSGPLFARPAEASQFMSDTVAGDFAFRNLEGAIRMGTSGGVSQISCVAGGGNVEISTALNLKNTGTTSDLVFPPDVKTNKLTLYGAVNGSYLFYGFGVTAGTLRYQVDQSSANHVFYAADAGGSTSTEVFRVLGTGGVKFTANSASGYSASTLNYYEEGTFLASFTGAITSTQTITFNRCGNRVTLQIPAFNSAFVDTNSINASIAIPTRLRPPGDVYSFFMVYNNGAIQAEPGWFRAANSGTINIFNSGGTNFTGGGNAGVAVQQSFTYLV